MNTVVSSLLLFLFCLPVFSVISAQTASPVPDVVSIASDGVINAVEQDDSNIYIGGNFNTIQIDDKPSIEQKNYAEVDIATRGLTSGQHTVNGTVTDIFLYQDRMYLAGEFTEINGIPQKYLTFFNKNTNELSEKDFAMGGPVYKMEAHENTLYVGGNFQNIDTNNRSNLFGLDLVTHSLTDWNPLVNDTVYAILIDNNRLYIGGAFTSVDGKPRSHLAAFDLNTKVLLDWTPEIEGTVRHMELKESILTITSATALPDTSIEERILAVNPDTGVTVVVNETNVTGTDGTFDGEVEGLMVDTSKLGFQIPSLADVLTFAIRVFFAIAGIAALFYLLLGAFAWVTSGGDKDAITAARDKIQAAIVGLIMMVVVLAVIWTLEQVVFKRRICLGISCPVTLPSLIEPL